VYVVAPTPFNTKFPVPTPIAKDPAPVASPIVIVLAAFVPIFTVVADVPLAIVTVFVALSEPIFIVFPPPTIDRFPDPAVNVTAPLDPPIEVVAEPPVFITVVPVIVNGAVLVTIPLAALNAIVPPATSKAPVQVVLPVAFPMLTAPVPPVPIVVVAPPEAFMEAVPTVVKVVKVPGPEVVEPIAGGEAKTAAKLAGLIA
jgi:hypothetical protein